MFDKCWCEPNDGMDYIPWVGQFTGICAYEWRDIIGIIAGGMNIFCWFILSLPQYKKMIKTRSAAGLSISMLLFWTVADVLGAIGLVLSQETGTLLWLTIFFSVNNTLGVAIWFFYDKILKTFPNSSIKTERCITASERFSTEKPQAFNEAKSQKPLMDSTNIAP